MNPSVESYRPFVCGLVEQMRPSKVLEIGVGHDAHTAVRILDVMTQNKIPESKLFLVDIEPHPRAKLALEQFPSDTYDFRIGNSNSQDLGHLRVLYQNIHHCNLVLIDADHTYDCCMRDIHNCIFLNLLAHNGLFVLHDVSSPSVRQVLLEAEKLFHLKTFIIPELNIGIARF
jgi:hypothetical protein